MVLALCMATLNRERIDGPAGDVAQTGDADATGGAEPDSPLSLLVRYFSVRRS